MSGVPAAASSQQGAPQSVPGSGRSTVRTFPRDWCFWFVMFSVNLQDILELWGIDTVFKPYRMAALALGVLGIPHLFVQWSVIRRWLLPLMAAYSYALLMTFLWGGVGGLVEFLPYAATAGALLVCTCTVSSLRSLATGCYAYIAGFWLSCLLGLTSEAGRFGGRFSGLFHNPNYFGYAACICIIFLLNPRLRFPGILRLLLVGFSFVFVFLSGSRGSAAAALLSGGTQIVKNPRLLGALVFLAAVAGVAGTMTESGLERFEKTNRSLLRRYTASEIERGGTGRLAVALAGLETGYERGFVGIGLDQFRKGYFQKHFPRMARLRKGKGLGLHNAYISLLTEWGLPATILVVVSFWRLFRDAGRSPWFRVWIQGFLWATFVMGLSGEVMTTPHFWLMFGFSIQQLRFSLLAQTMVRRRQQVPVRSVWNPAVG